LEQQSLEQVHQKKARARDSVFKANLPHLFTLGFAGIKFSLLEALSRTVMEEFRTKEVVGQAEGVVWKALFESIRMWIIRLNYVVLILQAYFDDELESYRPKAAEPQQKVSEIIGEAIEVAGRCALSSRLKEKHVEFLQNCGDEDAAELAEFFKEVLRLDFANDEDKARVVNAYNYVKNVKPKKEVSEIIGEAMEVAGRCALNFKLREKRMGFLQNCGDEDPAELAEFFKEVLRLGFRNDEEEARVVRAYGHVCFADDAEGVKLLLARLQGRLLLARADMSPQDDVIVIISIIEALGNIGFGGEEGNVVMDALLKVGGSESILVAACESLCKLVGVKSLECDFKRRVAHLRQEQDEEEVIAVSESEQSEDSGGLTTAPLQSSPQRGESFSISNSGSAFPPPPDVELVVGEAAEESPPQPSFR